MLLPLDESKVHPIKNYRGLSQNYRGKRWAYVHLIRGAASYPIIYLRTNFCLHHEAYKCVYLCILISEAPTNKKFHRKNGHYVWHILLLSFCKSNVRYIGLISLCKSDNCRCAKSLVIFTRSTGIIALHN